MRLLQASEIYQQCFVKLGFYVKSLLFLGGAFPMYVTSYKEKDKEQWEGLR